jgi:hypothetical protein
VATTPGEWWPLLFEPGKWTQAVTCHGAGTFSRAVRIFPGRHSIEAFHVSGLPWTNLLPVQALLGLWLGCCRLRSSSADSCRTARSKARGPGRLSCAQSTLKCNDYPLCIVHIFAE